ncbi:hypothetical protein ACEPPN_017320 [Leptodophora sp. 'Broadleaf-Isolate-01']
MRSTEQPKKLSFELSDFQRQVKVNVGDEDVEFYALKTILSIHSEYFRTACSVTWKSGREDCVTLHDHEPESFAVFLAWAYTDNPQSYAALSPIPERMAYKKRQEATLEQARLAVKCVVLGDMILAEEF